MEERSSELFIRQLTHELVHNGALANKEERPLDQEFKKSAQIRYDMFLLEEGLVKPEDLLTALAAVYRVPSFDVTDFFFEHHMLHFFPKDFLLRNAIIPAEQDDDILLVVAADPTDPDLLPKIGAFVSYDIQFCVGIYRDIYNAIEEFYDRSITEKDIDGQDAPEDEPNNYEFEIDEIGAVVDED